MCLYATRPCFDPVNSITSAERPSSLPSRQPQPPRRRDPAVLCGIDAVPSSRPPAAGLPAARTVYCAALGRRLPRLSPVSLAEARREARPSSTEARLLAAAGGRAAAVGKADVVGGAVTTAEARE